MASRILPWTWPVLALSSPVLVPKLLKRNRVFKANRNRAEKLNRQRITGVETLELPALDFLDLTVLVEEKAGEGFRDDPGVSYLVATNLGTLLLDVGFGPDSATLGHNAAKLGIDFSAVDAVAISHLHPDHMGGMAAFRSKSVRIPRDLHGLKGSPCFLPEFAETADLDAVVVNSPRILAAGVGTTGPLSSQPFLPWHVRGTGAICVNRCRPRVGKSGS